MRLVPCMGGSGNEYRILGEKLEGIIYGKCCKSDVKLYLEKVR
jgi:hypothetical protein